MKPILIVLFLVTLAAAKDKNPADYPETAKVLSFEQQRTPGGQVCRSVAATNRVNCVTISGEESVITLEIAGRRYQAVCEKECRPPLPGERFPARLNLGKMKLVLLRQDGNKWHELKLDVTGARGQ